MKVNPASLDLTTLRLLLAVIEEGNLARAATRENIAISAVSRRISNLEIRLGVTLLNRHDRGVEPTPAALLVVDRVRGVIGLLGQIVDDLDEVREGSRGLVRIQAHTTAAAGTLPGLLARFLANHPNIDVVVDEATSLAILDAIRHGLCDVGLVSGTVDPGELELISWGSDELVAALPADHPLATAQTISFDTLLAWPFVAMHRDSALNALYRGHARALGKPLIERAHVSSFDVALRMVGQGLGVAIMPREPSHGLAKLHDVVLRPLADEWTMRPLALCVRDLDTCSAATRALLSFLCEPGERYLSAV